MTKESEARQWKMMVLKELLKSRKKVEVPWMSHSFA